MYWEIVKKVALAVIIVVFVVIGFAGTLALIGETARQGALFRDAMLDRGCTYERTGTYFIFVTVGKSVHPIPQPRYEWVCPPNAGDER